MEVLDFIITLSIAIVTVIISIYAISVSLLGSQLKKNEQYIERRLKETEDEIKEIQEKNSSRSERISGIAQKIKAVKKEEKALKNILNCLSLKGAVIHPILPFIITLALGVEGIYVPSHVECIQYLSLFLFIYGSYRIYCTLHSIDFAAKNIPSPNFDAFFDESAEEQLEIEVEKKQTVRIDVTNTGYDVAEMVEIAIFFPPQFKIHKKEEYGMTIQPSKAFNHPFFTGIFFDVDILHVDTSIFVDVLVTAPVETGSYTLPVYVNERKTTQKEFELKLVVK